MENLLNSFSMLESDFFQVNNDDQKKKKKRRKLKNIAIPRLRQEIF